MCHKIRIEQKMRTFRAFSNNGRDSFEMVWTCPTQVLAPVKMSFSMYGDDLSRKRSRPKRDMNGSRAT